MLYKNKLSIFILVLSSLTSLNSYANAIIGLDLGHQGRGFKKGYGQEVFAKNASYSDIYIEKMFHEYFGIEAGMAVTKKKKRQAELGVGDAFPGGNAILVDGANETASDIKGRKYYLGIVGIYPLDNNIKVFGFIGFSRTWMQAQYTKLKHNNYSLIGANKLANINTFKTKGYNFILKVGAKYNITEKFGIRATLAWENTSKYTPSASQNISQNSQVKYKNTNQIGVGVYFTI